MISMKIFLVVPSLTLYIAMGNLQVKETYSTFVTFIELIWVERLGVSTIKQTSITNKQNLTSVPNVVGVDVVSDSPLCD
jgi:hypothetical protein